VQTGPGALSARIRNLYPLTLRYYGVGVGLGVGVGVGVGVADTQNKSDSTTFPGEVLVAAKSVQLPLVCIVL
jgi:hypothetical protein